MQYRQISDKLSLFISVMSYHIFHGVSLLKQNCLSSIAAMMEVCKKNVEPFLPELMEIIFSFSSSEKYQLKIYNQLKGQAIEAISLIASSIGPQMFRTSLGHLINIMENLQASPEENGPLNEYILSGWQRIIIAYKIKLGHQWNKIMPGLLRLLWKITKYQHVKTKNNNGLNSTSESANLENLHKVATLIQICIQCFKDLFVPYHQESVELINFLMKQFNDS